MFTNKKIVQHTINIVAFVVCLVFLFVGTGIINSLKETRSNMKSNIEKEWRQQAKRTLENVQDQFMYDVDHGLLDATDELALQQWAKRNISGILNGGPTGDMFMINLGDEKFLWDGSPDCAKPEFVTNGRYLKDEAQMHYDPTQAELIISKMRLAQSTLNTQDNYWWNFDGSPEFLEWVVIPPGALGFNSEPNTIGGVKNAKYNKILIALGTQEDEIESTFAKDFESLDHTISVAEPFVYASIAICIFNIIVFVYLNKKV
jgi:hypothetical protein